MNHQASRRLRMLPSILALAAIVVAPVLASAAESAAGQVSFSKDVQPILKASCIQCHSMKPKHKKGAAEFRLDDEKLAMKGGRAGQDIIPGNAKDSRMFQLLDGPVARPDKSEKDKEIPAMPLAARHKKWKQLPKDQIDTIGRWIDQGANWAS